MQNICTDNAGAIIEAETISVLVKLVRSDLRPRYCKGIEGDERDFEQAESDWTWKTAAMWSLVNMAEYPEYRTDLITADCVDLIAGFENRGKWHVRRALDALSSDERGKYLLEQHRRTHVNDKQMVDEEREVSGGSPSAHGASGEPSVMSVENSASLNESVRNTFLDAYMHNAI